MYDASYRVVNCSNFAAFFLNFIFSPSHTVLRNFHDKFINVPWFLFKEYNAADELIFSQIFRNAGYVILVQRKSSNTHRRKRARPGA